MNLNNKRQFRKNLIIIGLGLALSACGSESAEEIIENIEVPQNSAPTISSSATVTVEAGSEYSYSLDAADTDGDTLTLSASSLPAWLSFDEATGVLSGTPSDSDVGDHDITLTVSDGTDEITQTFTIAVTLPVVTPPVNNEPVITSTAGEAVVEGSAYSYTLTATDTDDDSLTMAAKTKPDWLSFDDETGVLMGTPAASDVGNYNIVLTVTDGTDEVTDSFTITVSALVVDNNAPVVTSTAIVVAEAGSDYSYTLIATDADDDSITMEATTLPEWLSFDEDTGILSGIPAAGNIGDHAVVITVSDNTIDVTDSFTITVSDNASVVGETPRDASEASFIISDGLNDWESWIETNGSSQVIVDDNAAYDNVNEVTITASGFVAGYRPVADVGVPIDMSAFVSTGTFEFDLKVTTAPAGTDEWFLKIEGGAGTLNDYSIFKDNGDHSAIELDVWQHYSFNLSDLAGLDLTAINNVMLFPAWGSNSGAVYQLDNFAFYPNGALEKEQSTPGESGDGATTTVAAGVDFEGPQLTWESFDTDKVQYVANPVTTGINTSATVALFDVLQDNGEWIGALTQGITSFELDTTNCLVKMDVYKDTISEVHVKFQKNNGVNGDGIMWGSHGSVGVANTVVNQWETLTFDTCHWVGLPETDNIGALAIFPDKTAGRSQDTMNYIDNIMFTGGVVVEPPTGELVVDGGFDSGAGSWTGANIITEGDNNVYFASVATAANPWDVNLSQVMTLVPGQTYTLTFRAKGDSRTIIAGLGENHGPWAAKTEILTLTADWTTYTYTFTIDFGDDNSRVLFDMGDQVGDVYLDDISVTVVD
ncbi:putative Ig domain-containing protein [Colwellia piezophila]|uniref:putative Ig domain-containing protein n=1 Tax=Colwellia piezophila TaxID=211668 RepID=UPI00036427CC|nr:putative Ig domain-containing protein [Colwellia piezophila]